MSGQGVSTYDLMDTITADMVKVNLLAIGAVFLILLLMKRQLLLPVILVLSIETAIWINLAIPYFRGRHVFYIAYLIISTIQLPSCSRTGIRSSARRWTKSRPLPLPCPP